MKAGIPSKKVGLEFKDVIKTVDQSQKIFEHKKGKEQHKFEQRHNLPPKAP